MTFDAYTAIWLFLGGARAGDTTAASLLAQDATKLKPEWPMPVIELFLNKTTTAAVTKASESADPVIAGNRRCEAVYYTSQWHHLRGETAQARALVDEALRVCQRTFVEYDAALADQRSRK